MATAPSSRSTPRRRLDQSAISRSHGASPPARSGFRHKCKLGTPLRLSLHDTAEPPYIAGPHSWADKFVPRHLSTGFGQLPFVYGDPLANQFDGSFLIGFVCKEIPHDSRFSLGIE